MVQQDNFEPRFLARQGRWTCTFHTHTHTHTHTHKRKHLYGATSMQTQVSFLVCKKKKKKRCLYTHTFYTVIHRMWSSPSRLFARCRSIGIECGQGGLQIDRGPLQRCAYWDLEEEVCVCVCGGGGIHLGPWCCLLYLTGGRFYSTWVFRHTTVAMYMY